MNNSCIDCIDWKLRESSYILQKTHQDWSILAKTNVPIHYLTQSLGLPEHQMTAHRIGASGLSEPSGGVPAIRYGTP